ncbi:MAG: UDP-N-acetylmuramoyl-L-alanyl-D-glutamate--2,6-diaminopimelate ligase [Puniceicoccales bacterium]|jgi:MiaB-like tRNA modifying enzyme|nr:UDP-N-acetylmuramoyl-L-alanyl-D-glutamate--2,6-diaminopimelate ligase [Puniceicoccales bacterium]
MSEHYDDIWSEIRSLGCGGAITCDSRRIKMGDIFFAIPGLRHPGYSFCKEALQRGCFGVVIQKDESEAFYYELGEKIKKTHIWIVDNIRQQFVCALKKELGIVGQERPIFAVTGTNGKTTITYLLRHLMDIPMAVIGTIQNDLVDKIIPSEQTTPNLEDLYYMIAGLANGVAVAIELSSHALDQGRAYGLEIDRAIFSNLTSDHLDYHRDCEHYFCAKRKLFSGENGYKPKRNILNLNDTYGQHLYREFGGITYGIENEAANYNATDLQFSRTKTTFNLKYENKVYFCEIPLLGVFNIENALASVAAIHESRNLSLEQLIEKLRNFPGVPGRLQKVNNTHNVTILIDYAHTEDGLGKVLSNLQKIKQRRIITIFGCGGDRDRSKRPKMMHVACYFSDFVIATSDNSRHESIDIIFDDMRPGMIPERSIIFEPDRAKAIQIAIEESQRDDIILIAGKGHETYQQIDDSKIPFSDVDVVEDFLLHMSLSFLTCHAEVFLKGFQTMRIYVHTHGCRLNAAESRSLVEALEAAGHIIVCSMDEVIDCAIVNSCAVTHQAESKCNQTIRQIIRAQPNVTLIITGCLAEKTPQILLQLHHRILILGNSEKHHIIDYLGQLDRQENFREVVKNPLEKSDFTFPCCLHRSYNKRYNLKIQEGCNFFCSYCIIPQLRGRARSRDFKNLIEDATIHAKQGVKEIVLTGVNMGIYRNDSKNLADIITVLNEIPELQRIRLSSIELKTIPDEILIQMADSCNKLVPYLHLPIQSGSDHILQLMRRHYTIIEAKNYLEQVVKKVPNIGLGTDLIVGFPGEREEDFLCSMELLEHSPLHYAHIFSYSPRGETVANLMKDQFINGKEIERRSKVLRSMSHEKRQRFYNTYIGAVEKVLFEDKAHNGFPGFTENYIKVIVKKKSEDLANQIRSVHLVKNCGTFLTGEIID